MGCHIGGGGVQFICLVGCRLPSLDGYVSVCLVLTKEVFGRVDTNSFVTYYYYYHASNLKCPVLWIKMRILTGFDHESFVLVKDSLRAVVNRLQVLLGHDVSPEDGLVRQISSKVFTLLMTSGQINSCDVINVNNATLHPPNLFFTCFAI